MAAQSAQVKIEFSFNQKELPSLYLVVKIKSFGFAKE